MAEETKRFREKLSRLCALGGESGMRLSVQQIGEVLKDEHLSLEQLQLIYNYLDQMSIDQDLSIAMKPEESYNFMTDLDKIYFGQMSDTKLSTTTTNPGYTNPQYYEEIAKAINERIRSNPFRKKSQS